MTRKSILTTAAALMIAAGAYSQTLQSAQNMVKEGNYAEAKDFFERRVKAAPSNAANNYWYGVCCAHTGEEAKAVKYLQNAVKRKYKDAYPELTDVYMRLYRFDEAADTASDYIDLLKKGKDNNETAKAEKLERAASDAVHMFGGVEKLNVIDSVVVDKADFTEYYRISKESGRLYPAGLTEGIRTDGTAYLSELGNTMLYTALSPDSVMQIYERKKDGSDWGRARKLPAPINGTGNSGYPYLMSDGMTIYFASEDNSIGGYDIFVTSFNTNTDSYLTPQNMGMPYNSPWNDYMMVIDEFNNLGWFASDRFQPEGKVCIYVFVPNDSRNAYNPEETDKDFLKVAASLQSFRDVQYDDKAVYRGLERLRTVIEEQARENKQRDFEFVIDDNRTYVNIYDFRNKRAQEMFLKLQQKQNQLGELQNRLDKARIKYHNGNEGVKENLAPSILDMERQEMQMLEDIRQTEKEIRNAEIGGN